MVVRRAMTMSPKASPPHAPLVRMISQMLASATLACTSHQSCPQCCSMLNSADGAWHSFKAVACPHLDVQRSKNIPARRAWGAAVSHSASYGQVQPWQEHHKHAVTILGLQANIEEPMPVMNIIAEHLGVQAWLQHEGGWEGGSPATVSCHFLMGGSQTG